MEGLNSSNIRLLYSALYGRYGSEKTPIKNVNTLLKNNLKNRRDLKKVKRVSIMAGDLRDIIRGK